MHNFMLHEQNKRTMDPFYLLSILINPHFRTTKCQTAFLKNNNRSLWIHEKACVEDYWSLPRPKAPLEPFHQLICVKRFEMFLDVLSSLSPSLLCLVASRGTTFCIGRRSFPYQFCSFWEAYFDSLIKLGFWMSGEYCALSSRPEEGNT